MLRGLLGTTGGLLAFYAFSRLPLADAYAIIFATPLLITALSVPILGEAVGWRRWSAVAVGFVGVLVMLRPGVAPIGLGSLAALGAACASALRDPPGAQAQRHRDHRQHRVLQQPHGGGAHRASRSARRSSCRALLDLALMAASGLIGGTALLVLIAGLPARARRAGRAVPVQPDALGDPARAR